MRRGGQRCSFLWWSFNGVILERGRTLFCNEQTFLCPVWVFEDLKECKVASAYGTVLKVFLFSFDSNVGFIFITFIIISSDSFHCL